MNKSLNSDVLRCKMEKQRRKFLSQLTSQLAGIGTLAAAPILTNAASSYTQVQNIRISREPSKTRLVFDLDGAVDYSLFSMHKPERLVIDLKQTRLMNAGVLEELHSTQLKGIRTGVRKMHDLRIVLDLKSRTTPNSFLLEPKGNNGYRLVIDVKEQAGSRKREVVQKKKLRDVVVAIDAGHGGNDPGATGRLGTHEKQVTLQIAKRLKKAIDGTKGMRGELIRRSDRFMRLRERIKRAHELDADLMISIHADSFPDVRARGASVYALSVSGATSESARLLAEKENKVDLLFGDVDLNHKDKMVRQVLLDLSLTGTIESSLDIGDEVLKELGRVGRVHKKKVQQAGFAVLKAPNIPAILLETAFISNPKEERKLRSSAHQSKLATAILRGVNDYFSRKAPPGTWLSEAQEHYTIKRGDTLAGISDKYHLPVSHLRTRNSLRNDELRVGKKLYIPVS
ncbi:MAG: N-acetylmuramoyl-L-alanine amidase [endosymbiont of Galathealinum brachiosum]|uniref:N-acetylmuramoyl-L-alanine amidase AmiC n=1 Tax=endosymbiont of Galathealinum brachiosum TaxID=2200906 RepID=A0A370DM26_9GAMM|nr:MAG: N-acetylmuramoyl-L-alanine amidase [endosymbiont of Galathealinum brachiosum]